MKTPKSAIFSKTAILTARWGRRGAPNGSRVGRLYRVNHQRNTAATDGGNLIAPQGYPERQSKRGRGARGEFSICAGGVTDGD